MPAKPDFVNPRSPLRQGDIYFPSNAIRLSLAAKCVSVTPCVCAYPSPRNPFSARLLVCLPKPVAVYPRVPFPRRKVLALLPTGFEQPLENINSGLRLQGQAYDCSDRYWRVR